MTTEIMDGEYDPAEGESVRVRVLRGEDGSLWVEYPGEEASLRVKQEGTSELDIPNTPGTYDISGEVVGTMYVESTEGEKVDSVTLTNPDVERISEDIEPLPREDYGPEWESGTAEDVDLDVDVADVMSEEVVESQSAEQSSRRVQSTEELVIGDVVSLDDNYNELLLGDL
jgi:hypothetical protein